MGRSRKQAGTLSKRKGNKLELETAKWLTSWWGGAFKRTPSSGGWHKSKVFDVMRIREKGLRFPFGVECKNSNAFQLSHFYNGKRSAFHAWWLQVLTSCKKYTKRKVIPMLVFTRNYIPTLIALPFNLPLLPRLIIRSNGRRVFIYTQRAVGKLRPKQMLRFVDRYEQGKGKRK